MDGVVILLKLWLKTQRITYMRKITEIDLRERDERKRVACVSHAQTSQLLQKSWH